MVTAQSSFFPNIARARSEHLPNSGRPLRIMMTVNAAWNIWNFRRPLVAAMLADGHEVIVLAPGDATAASLTAMGCRVIDLPMDLKGLNPVRDASLIIRLRQCFVDCQPDVVFGFTIKNNIYGALAARLAGVSFVPNVTGLGTAFISRGGLQAVVQLLYRLAFAKVPQVLFQNRDDLELFVERGLVSRARTRLVPGSGIDLAHFGPSKPPAKDGATVFLMVARLLRDKGVREFAEAARLVRNDHPNVRFQLLGAAGSANRSAIDLAAVKGWSATHGIEYLGTSTDVRCEIANADCVVLPSYREGAPRTLIEAAAMGRPVIATDVPGCRDVVDDRVSGYLCQVRSAASLAETCLRFLQLSLSERHEMGRAGRAKMEREYDVALVTQAYRDVLKQVVDQGDRQ
jgi:glycosyltransferase involved in cell wall biosynthesis